MSNSFRNRDDRNSSRRSERERSDSRESYRRDDYRRDDYRRDDSRRDNYRRDSSRRDDYRRDDYRRDDNRRDDYRRDDYRRDNYRRDDGDKSYNSSRNYDENSWDRESFDDRQARNSSYSRDRDDHYSRDKRDREWRNDSRERVDDKDRSRSGSYNGSYNQSSSSSSNSSTRNDDNFSSQSETSRATVTRITSARPVKVISVSNNNTKKTEDSFLSIPELKPENETSPIQNITLNDSTMSRYAHRDTDDNANTFIKSPENLQQKKPMAELEDDDEFETLGPTNASHLSSNSIREKVDAKNHNIQISNLTYLEDDEEEYEIQHNIIQQNTSDDESPTNHYGINTPEGKKNSSIHLSQANISSIINDTNVSNGALLSPLDQNSTLNLSNNLSSFKPDRVTSMGLNEKDLYAKKSDPSFFALTSLGEDPSEASPVTSPIKPLKPIPLSPTPNNLKDPEASNLVGSQDSLNFPLQSVNLNNDENLVDNNIKNSDNEKEKEKKKKGFSSFFRSSKSEAEKEEKNRLKEEKKALENAEKAINLVSSIDLEGKKLKKKNSFSSFFKGSRERSDSISSRESVDSKKHQSDKEVTPITNISSSQSNLKTQNNSELPPLPTQVSTDGLPTKPEKKHSGIFSKIKSTLKRKSSKGSSISSSQDDFERKTDFSDYEEDQFLNQNIDFQEEKERDVNSNELTTEALKIHNESFNTNNYKSNDENSESGSETLSVKKKKSLSKLIGLSSIKKALSRTSSSNSLKKEVQSDAPQLSHNSKSLTASINDVQTNHIGIANRDISFLFEDGKLESDNEEEVTPIVLDGNDFDNLNLKYDEETEKPNNIEHSQNSNVSLTIQNPDRINSITPSIVTTITPDEKPDIHKDEFPSNIQPKINTNRSYADKLLPTPAKENLHQHRENLSPSIIQKFQSEKKIEKNELPIRKSIIYLDKNIIETPVVSKQTQPITQNQSLTQSLAQSITKPTTHPTAQSSPQPQKPIIPTPNKVNSSSQPILSSMTEFSSSLRASQPNPTSKIKSGKGIAKIIHNSAYKSDVKKNSFVASSSKIQDLYEKSASLPYTSVNAALRTKMAIDQLSLQERLNKFNGEISLNEKLHDLILKSQDMNRVYQGVIWNLPNRIPENSEKLYPQLSKDFSNSKITKELPKSLSIYDELQIFYGQDSKVEDIGQINPDDFDYKFDLSRKNAHLKKIDSKFNNLHLSVKHHVITDKLGRKYLSLISPDEKNLIEEESLLETFDNIKYQFESSSNNILSDGQLDEIREYVQSYKDKYGFSDNSEDSNDKKFMYKYDDLQFIKKMTKIYGYASTTSKNKNSKFFSSELVPQYLSYRNNILEESYIDNNNEVLNGWKSEVLDIFKSIDSKRSSKLTRQILKNNILSGLVHMYDPYYSLRGLNIQNEHKKNIIKYLSESELALGIFFKGNLKKIQTLSSKTRFYAIILCPFSNSNFNYSYLNKENLQKESPQTITNDLPLPFSTHSIYFLVEYEKAVNSMWGVCPMNLKYVYPLEDLVSISTNPNKRMKGKYFTLNFALKNPYHHQYYNLLYKNSRSNDINQFSSMNDVFSQFTNKSDYFSATPNSTRAVSPHQFNLNDGNKSDINASDLSDSSVKSDSSMKNRKLKKTFSFLSRKKSKNNPPTSVPHSLSNKNFDSAEHNESNPTPNSISELYSKLEVNTNIEIDDSDENESINSNSDTNDGVESLDGEPIYFMKKPHPNAENYIDDEIIAKISKNKNNDQNIVSPLFSSNKIGPTLNFELKLMANTSTERLQWIKVLQTIVGAHPSTKEAVLYGTMPASITTRNSRGILEDSD